MSLNSEVSENQNLNSSFNLKVRRRSDEEIIFDTEQELSSETFFSMGDLNSKFNQISVKRSPDEVLFGIGEGITTINLGLSNEGANTTQNNSFDHHPFYVKVSILFLENKAFSLG